jgi:hypothetical protein
MPQDKQAAAALCQLLWISRIARHRCADAIAAV